MTSAKATILTTVLLLAACSDVHDADTAVGLLARDRIVLSAEAAEPVTEWLVAEGDAVAAGQALLRLDDRRLAAQAAQARANREQAQRRLDELVRGPRQERVLEARARLAGAESRLETARRDYRRVEALVASEALTASDRDRARAERDSARATRDAAAAGLEELLQGTTLEALDQARAALAAAEAALEHDEATHERLLVRAPVAGRVEALPHRVGERPAAGAPVAVLLSSERIYARVYVPQALHARLQPGAAARVTMSGDGARSFDGRLRYLASEAAFTPYFALTERDAGRLSYLAEVELDPEQAGTLPAGVPVRVRFPQ